MTIPMVGWMLRPRHGVRSSAEVAAAMVGLMLARRDQHSMDLRDG